jgi:hypothetical protein
MNSRISLNIGDKNKELGAEKWLKKEAWVDRS